MGNSHKNSSKHTHKDKVEKNVTNDEIIKEQSTNYDDQQIEEGLNIQFVERIDFKNSENVTASKNLMHSTTLSSRITLGCTRELQKENCVTEVLNSILLPSTNTFYKKIKHLPEF